MENYEHIDQSIYLFMIFGDVSFVLVELKGFEVRNSVLGDFFEFFSNFVMIDAPMYFLQPPTSTTLSKYPPHIFFIIFPKLYVYSSLKKRLNLVKAFDLIGFIYSFKTTTEGILIFIDGELT